MVDALRRAHRMVTLDGFVVDLHPSATPASVEVGGTTTGHVHSADAPLRHAAAGVALASVIDEGLFTIDRTTTFTFFSYGDSIDEVRDHVEKCWRNSRIDDPTVDRTRQALRAAPHSRPCTRENVYVTRLRPGGR